MKVPKIEYFSQSTSVNYVSMFLLRINANKY